MTQVKRITLGVIALVAMIAVMGALAISHLDLNHHKKRIEQLVLEQSGRQLQINGPMNVSVFPWLGLSLQDVSMGNAEEFGETEFASVQSSELKVQALPLMMGKVKVKSVLLHGLSLKLMRDADGKTNWDDLMSTTAVVETETDSDVVQEVEAGAPVIAALSVGGVQVSNANISYSDERDTSYVALNDLNLNTGTITLSEPFAFESDFSLIHSAGSGLTSVVSARGEIAVDLGNNIYRLQQLRLSTVNAGAALPVEPLPVSFNGELVANLNAQSVDIMVSDGLLSGVPVSGEFHATDVQQDLRLTGRLSSGEFNAAPVLEQLAWWSDVELDSELLQATSLSARFEQTQDALLIQDANLSVSNVDITGDFQITNLSNAAVLSGQLQSNRFNLSPWAKSFGIEVSDASVMQEARLSTSVRQSGQLLSFNQLDIQLDQSNITGDVELSDIKADNLPITYALAVDAINLDSYLSPRASNNVPAQTAESQSEDGQSADGQSEDDKSEDDKSVEGDADRLVPVELLRRMDLKGDIYFGAVTVAGITAQNATLPVSAKDGRIEVSEAKAELYAGSFFSTASLDVQSDEPRLTIAANLNGLNTEPLLQDALGKEAPLTGVANLSVDLLSRGLSWLQLRERANGALSLRVTDGQLSGIDMLSELYRAGRLLNDGQSDDSNQDPDSVSSKTDFNELSLSAVVADGLLQSDDLVFASPYLQVTGEGGVNLASHHVDFLLHLLISNTAALQQDDELLPVLQRLSGLSLTLPVQGSFTDLSVDFTGLLIHAFNSGLADEIKSRIGEWSTASKADLARRIELEKEALKQRLEQEREDAAALIREKKLQTELSVDERKQQLELQLEEKKDALREKLQNNLKKELNELLGEN